MLTRLYLVSGDGIGAGKTTLAKRLGGQSFSLAGAMRAELCALYPGYDWWNRSQDYKANTRVPEAGGLTVREVLLRHGQSKCQARPEYWAELLAEDIVRSRADAVTVDDVRKLVELNTFRAVFPRATVLHFHIHNPAAQHEPEFDADALRTVADYVVIWGEHERHTQSLHGHTTSGAGRGAASGTGGVAASRRADPADAGWRGQVAGGALPGQLGWQRHPLYPDERPGAAVPGHVVGSPDDPEWYAPWLGGS